MQKIAELGIAFDAELHAYHISPYCTITDYKISTQKMLFKAVITHVLTKQIQLGLMIFLSGMNQSNSQISILNMDIGYAILQQMLPQELVEPIFENVKMGLGIG